MSYIDKDMLKRYFKPEEWGTPDERWMPESDIAKWIESLPISDCRIKCGVWTPVIIGEEYDPESDEETEVYGVECSECGKQFRDDSKFCPNCGTLMKGVWQ